MRIVVDTNVLVSSFFGGNPRTIIDLWRDGHVTLCLSREIIDEYVDVLIRLGLGGEQELQELLGLFGRGVNVVYTAHTPDLQVVAADPDDDKFIACAVALDAKLIVTDDKALLAVERYMDIEIVAPKEAAGLLKGH